MNDEKCIEIPEFGKNDQIDWYLLPSLLPFLPKKIVISVHNWVFFQLRPVSTCKQF